MLKISTYVVINKDDMPKEWAEKKQFHIYIDENQFKYLKMVGGSFKDLYENKIKPDIIKDIDMIFESSDYIKDELRGEE